MPTLVGIFGKKAVEQTVQQVLKMPRLPLVGVPHLAEHITNGLVRVGHRVPALPPRNVVLEVVVALRDEHGQHERPRCPVAREKFRYVLRLKHVRGGRRPDVPELPLQPAIVDRFGTPVTTNDWIADQLCEQIGDQGHGVE